MMHVGIDIEDKPKLFAVVRRVSKNGGIFEDFPKPDIPISTIRATIAATAN